MLEKDSGNSSSQDTLTDADSSENGFSTGKLLGELDFPVANWRASHKDLQEQFVKAVDPLGRFLVASSGRINGPAPFAIFQNLTRALTDVITGFHLIIHAYLNQGHNVLRSAIEACDLVELFVLDADEGKKWVNSSQAHADFRPSDVRQRLDKERRDPIYEHFSEIGTHPRFLGASLAGYVNVRVGESAADSVPSTHMHIGPYLPDEPVTMHAALWALQLTALLGIRMRALVGLTSSVDESSWGRALNECGVALSDAAIIVKEELLAGGWGEVDFLDEAYDQLVNETSRFVQTESDRQ